MQGVEFESRTSGMRALVYSPAVDVDDGRVILYLHGSGGFGTGFVGLFEYPDLPSLLRDGMALTSTVLIPSCHVGDSWQPGIVGTFLDDFERTIGKAAIKYDVMGYSRGGIGAFQFAGSAPERVGTIVTISGRAALDVAAAIAGIPTLLVLGEWDKRVPVEESRRMYQALCDAGGMCELRVVDGGHFIVADVLADGGIFEWQRRAGDSRSLPT